MTLVLCVGLFSGQHGPVYQVARVIGAVADLGEATSAAAVQAINATNALASSASALVSVATHNGLTAGANLWHGIDLDDIRAQRCAGAITAANSHFLVAWLHSPAAKLHFPCLDANLTARLCAAIHAVNVDLPSTQAVSEDLFIYGSFVSIRVAATWHDHDKVSIRFDGHFLSFMPVWANPIWGKWGFGLESEREQILQALRALLLDLPAAPAQTSFCGY